jgi:hypothetical protein
VSFAKQLATALHAVPAFIAALVGQLVLTVLLTPWYAPTDEEFFDGARRALVIALVAHVIIRFAWARLLRAKTYPGEPEGGSDLSRKPSSGLFRLSRRSPLKRLYRRRSALSTRRYTLGANVQ